MLLCSCLLLLSCTKELQFEQKIITKKSTAKLGEVTEIALNVPVASATTVVSDSINKAVFAAMKEIVYVGETPFKATNYAGLVTAFINYYVDVKKTTPSEPAWSATVDGKLVYKSSALLNIELTYYTFTGGAHGYGGKRSLLFDVETGKSIANNNLFTDEKGFKKLAEIKFRSKYKIPAKALLNTTDFMFENDVFQLPQTYFFTNDGFLLFYNVYEIASYAQGNFEVLIPYAEMKPYLKTI